MPKKSELLAKLYAKPMPKNFTVNDLNSLMNKCDCTKNEGGRGSGVKYVHNKTNRVLAFDLPHPGKELYIYQIKMVKEFIDEIGEGE